MGLQSFQFPVDFLNNLEKPIIYLAKQDKTIIDSVAIYDDLSLTCNLNAFQTASFKIHRDIDGKKQNYFSAFEDEMLIMIPGISWYEIHVETNIEPNGITKTVTANSLECKLCDKRLIDFECNAGEILYDDYVRTIFYDPTNPEGSLLHRVLNVSPNWSVGHVDDSLANKQRTFDVDDTDVYSFLTGEVSEAFNCLFVFDTFNCTVNAYDLDDYGSDTNIFVSMDNLAQNMTESVEENSIFTCYRVNGGDGVYINEVNPNGTNKIYNFEYYLPQMSQEIQAKINSYNTLFQNLKSQYEDVMLRMQTQIDVIQELYTRLPDSLSSKDWTLYGLNFLETKKKSFETMDQLYCAYGYNKSTSPSYNLYKQNLQDLKDVTAEYNVRQAEIDDATEVYDSIKEERNVIQEQLDMDNFFTVDEWKSIDNYVKEETYTNDNYIVTDQEDDSERFEIERQLYEAAWKDLSKKCRPQYQYSATLSNILTILEFKDFVKYFELGNFIRMETDYDTIVRLRIISFTVNYNDTNTIDVTFSDAIRVKDVYEDAASIQAQANSAAMSFQFNKDQYDKTVKQGNFVAEMRKYGLDVATTAIHNASNQSQVWDETGMLFRHKNEQSGEFDPEQIKIINNMMVFTDSNWDDTKMAIGKVALSNGNFAYGVNAEVFVGTAIFSQYFTAQNDSGTFKIDNTGFNATNGTNTIKIQPNNSGELFSIYKNSDKQFYITSDGDVEFSGILQGSRGVFSGLLSGGSINIGNGSFEVDEEGLFSIADGKMKFDGKSLSLSNDVKISWDQVTGTNNVATISYVDNTLTNYVTDGELSASLSLKIGKDDNDQIVSMINASSDVITLNSNRLIIDSSNFKLSKNGRVTIKDTLDYAYGDYMAHIISHDANNRPKLVMHTGIFNGDLDVYGELRADYFYGMAQEAEYATYAEDSIRSDYAAKSETATYLDGSAGRVRVGSAGFIPLDGGSLRLGGPGYKWTEVFAETGEINTSDRNEKKSIESLDDEKYIALFERLIPVSFQYINGASGRTHIGFISQDVEEAMKEVDLTSLEFAGFCKDEIENEDGTTSTVYGLRYSEFIALNTLMIQRTKNELSELKKLLQDKNII